MGRGERPVSDTAAFALAATATLVPPAEVIAYALDRPIFVSVDSVLASDPGAVLLAPAVVHPAGQPP